MASQNHVHTYVKYKHRRGYFRCAAPDCTHFLDREAVVGKLSKCPDCLSHFILDVDNLKLVKPKCLNCRTSKKALAYQAGQRLVQNLPIFSIGAGAPEMSEEKAEGGGGGGS